MAQELFHLSLNPEKDVSIVLIHGLLSSHLEWDHVTPHLNQYHVLVIDAPGHSGSANVLPVRDPAPVDCVADFIRQKAHSGKAHVVGLSMGGFITLQLARRYPELVLSAFVTGAAPFAGWQLALARRPTLVYCLMGALDGLPDSVYWWAAEHNGLQRHEALRAEMRKNRRFEVIRDVYANILEFGWEEVRQIKARTLAVAGARQDPIEPVKRMGQIWREEEDKGMPQRRAAMVREAVHAWDLQLPDLFAAGILAWIESRELPDKFEKV